MAQIDIPIKFLLRDYKFNLIKFPEKRKPAMIENYYKFNKKQWSEFDKIINDLIAFPIDSTLNSFLDKKTPRLGKNKHKQYFSPLDQIASILEKRVDRLSGNFGDISKKQMNNLFYITNYIDKNYGTEFTKRITNMLPVKK